MQELFKSHRLNNSGFEEVEQFKTQMRKTVSLLEKLAAGNDNDREIAIFKTKMEEASFFGTKSIAMKKNNQEQKW
jgi:hypothetical protein